MIQNSYVLKGPEGYLNVSTNTWVDFSEATKFSKEMARFLFEKIAEVLEIEKVS